MTCPVGKTAGAPHLVWKPLAFFEGSLGFQGVCQFCFLLSAELGLGADTLSRQACVPPNFGQAQVNKQGVWVAGEGAVLAGDEA